jgi:hypothetical protein
MALLTRPSLLTIASRAIYTWLNSRVTDLYGIIGDDVNGRGSLNYLNLSPTADLAPSQGRGTFATLTDPDTLGTQIITRATQITSLLLVTSGNIATEVTIADGATTMAIAQPTLYFQRFKFLVGYGTDGLVTTITGGTAGRTYHIVLYNANATEDVAFVHQGGNVANSIHLKPVDPATVPIRVIYRGSDRAVVGTFFFGDLNGSGVNQFWEL